MGSPRLPARTSYPVFGRVLATVLTVVGAWFVIYGISTLLQVSDVTERWVTASQDPNYPFEFEMFRFWAGLLCVGLVTLGTMTIVYGTGVVRQMRWARGWPWLVFTFVAIVIHSIRALAQTIDHTMDNWIAASFILICVTYAAVWLLTRRRRRRSNDVRESIA